MGRATRRRSTKHDGAARDHGTRGAALVELAVVTPFLLLLLFGVVQYGLAYRNALTITHAARIGARTAVGMGKDPSADWQVLQAVRSSADRLGTIEAVVVFRSTATDGGLPPACRTSGVSGVCNRYVARDLTITEVNFRAAAYTSDDFWPASSRNVSQLAPGGPDYLGVYVQVRHSGPMNQMFGSALVADQVVMRLDEFTVLRTTTTRPATTATLATTTTRATTTTTVATTTTTKAATTTTTATGAGTTTTTSAGAGGSTTTTVAPTTTTTRAPTTTTVAPTTTTAPATTTTTRRIILAPQP